MMTEMTAETRTEIDDDITLADGKRTLTNSQLLILGFIASGTAWRAVPSPSATSPKRCRLA